MKKITHILLLAIAATVIYNCNGQKKVINRQVEHHKYGTMLLGLQSISQFTKSPFSDWYIKEKQEYIVDKKGIEQLRKQKLHQFNITAFVGTWCEDSHRELPRLIKILEQINYPLDKLEIIALNRKKESPNGEEVMNHIERVPTFIISKNNKEIGRIVEFPKSGYIERDLVEITDKYHKNNNNTIKNIINIIK